MCAHLKNSSLPFFMSRTTEQIRKLQSLGLCTNCGKPNDRAGKYITCTACASKKKELYEKRKSDRKCVDCGAETDGNNCRCAKCRKQNASDSRNEYVFLKESGICVQCKTYIAKPGRVRCEVCLLKNSKRTGNVAKKYHSEYMKKKRQEAKAEGICVACLKRKAVIGWATCAECATANRKRLSKRRESNGSISYERAVEDGICTMCRREKATHGKVCSTCYAKLLERGEKGRQARRENGKTHFWIQDNRVAFMAK